MLSPRHTRRSDAIGIADLLLQPLDLFILERLFVLRPRPEGVLGPQ
jgi:hypothetical protein